MTIARHFKIRYFAFNVDEFQTFITVKQSFDVLIDIADCEDWAILVH